MKLRADLRLYVICMRGWAEVRAARVPPTASVTKHSKTITESMWVPPPPMSWQDGTYTPVERTITLTTTTWKGGRVLASMRLSALRDMKLGRLGRDTCRQVDPKSRQGKKLMDYIDGKRNI